MDANIRTTPCAIHPRPKLVDLGLVIAVGRPKGLPVFSSTFMWHQLIQLLMMNVAYFP